MNFQAENNATATRDQPVSVSHGIAGAPALEIK